MKNTDAEIGKRMKEVFARSRATNWGNGSSLPDGTLKGCWLPLPRWHWRRLLKQSWYRHRYEYHTDQQHALHILHEEFDPDCPTRQGGVVTREQLKKEGFT